MLLNKLSKTQEKLIDEVKNEWLEFTLKDSTPINQKQFYKGIDWLYSLCKLKKPIKLILDSPLACQIAANWLNNKKSQVWSQIESQVRSQVWSQVGSQVRSQIWSQVGSQIGSQVWSQVRSQIWSQVGSQIWSQVGSQVRSQVWSQVGSQVRSQVRSQIWSQVGSQIWSQIWSQVWSQVGSQIGSQVGSQVESQVRSQIWSQVGSQIGSQVGSQIELQVRSQVWSQVGSQIGSQVESQVRSQVESQVKDFFEFSGYTLYWNSGWVSFYDYFKRIGIVKHELLDSFLYFLKSGHVLSIYLDGLAIGCNKPLKLKRDNQNRLHCDNGPAILWRDGYKQYFWHGISVTQQIIENPETITKKQIQKEKNSEVQRVIVEKLGWDKYLQLVEIKLIDKWFDLNTSCHYELYDFKNRTGSMQPKLLKMESPELHDGTRPYYIEPVPPESKTCLAARRWQCDPSRPNIEECNKNSELIFELEQ